ncbi:uncharacterized protein LOC100842125 [Brachypodium distachyon]|uniref:Uncharacterized protein n=1 Tax=Brachypodium distachyon TaxID=15368 RepID=I1HNX2_BRADI|nr:uncharacterized protein LOC100842125 [Brachypodium distachyon]PNT72269.1 hypothetical protein BRADI_2g42000v3 [Brachypodium distachyon]|eukprot:XP_003566814.1 uncharacterized protein LOC100842125 [Brachypodium distachyon]
MEAEQRDWSSLPEDLLDEILRRLRWSSHPSFASTCRAWRSAVPPFYRAWVTPVLLNTAHVGTTNLRFYSPYFHKNFEIDCTLDAPGAKICCSTGHRLTVCVDHLIMDAQLHTGHIHKLPRFFVRRFHFVVRDRRKVLGLKNTLGMLEITRCIQHGDGKWGHREFWDTDSYRGFFASPVRNPVFHRGLLYVLGEDGRLAVYDERCHDKGFEILDSPMSFGAGLDFENSYLLDSDQGELMAILVGRHGTPVHVVKLNEQTMEWDKVESLEGRTLFTGTLATMIKKTDVKWMHNKVFLPRLYEWPETIHVNLVERGGEFAFVPKSGCVDATVKDGDHTFGAMMCSYELGQNENATEFWWTEKLNYSIWLDFDSATSVLVLS